MKPLILLILVGSLCGCGLRPDTRPTEDKVANLSLILDEINILANHKQYMEGLHTDILELERRINILNEQIKELQRDRK